MQAAVGGGTEGLYQTMVELDGLHYAVTVSYNIYSAISCIFPNGIGQIRPPRDGTEKLAPL